MFTKTLRASLTLSFFFFAPGVSLAADTGAERGRYLVMISGCNDCHTAGFAASGGAVAEADWLLGDSLGYRGPWGTTYPSNLREHASRYSEAEWVGLMKNLRTRPPMPWWALNSMTEADLGAVHQYLTSLGTGGVAAPAYVPPAEEPATPYIQWPSPPPPLEAAAASDPEPADESVNCRRKRHKTNTKAGC